MNKLEQIKQSFFSNKNFLLLWGAQIYSQSAISIIVIVLGILSYEGILSSDVKGSVASIGIIVNLATLPGFFLAPIAGVFVDWFDKKIIMLLSILARIILFGIYILFRGWENLWLSYSLIFVFSVILQFFVPAEGGLIAQIIGKRRVLLANSLLSLTLYSVMILGIAFSGHILDILGVELSFAVCGVCFILSFILVAVTNINGGDNSTFPSGHLVNILLELIKDAGRGVRYVYQTKVLRFALIHLLFLQIIGLTLVTISFRIGSEIYGVSPRTAGLVVFAPVIVGLTIGIALLNTFGKMRSRVKLIVGGSFLSLIALSCMVVIAIAKGLLSRFALDQIFSTVSLIAIGLAIPFLLIPAQTLIYENAKANFRGRVFGIWLALTSAIASLIAFLIGALVDATSDISIAVICLMGVNLVYSIILIHLIGKGRL